MVTGIRVAASDGRACDPLVPDHGKGEYMTRRFDVGPMLIALAAMVLLVSLFLDWYGPLTAWEAFEVVEVLLAALAVAALVAAFGALAPELAFLERRWLPAIVLAITVLVAAEILNPPPAAGPELPSTGAWLAFASALVMLIGTVLSFGRVSFAVSVEGRETRERVAVVDHRQDTTESAPVPADPEPRRSMWRGSVADPAAARTEGTSGDTPAADKPTGRGRKSQTRAVGEDAAAGDETAGRAAD